MSRGAKINPLLRSRFAKEYLVDFDGSAAIKRAGWKGKRPEHAACRLMRLPEVQEKIIVALERLNKPAEVTAEKVVGEIAKLAFSNIQDYIETDRNTGARFIDIENLPRSVAAAIQEVTFEESGTGTKTVRRTKIKLFDKQKALDQLMRYLGQYITKIEHSGPDRGPIQVADANMLEVARRYAFVLKRGAAIVEGEYAEHEPPSIADDRRTGDTDRDSGEGPAGEQPAAKLAGYKRARTVAAREPAADT